MLLLYLYKFIIKWIALIQVVTSIREFIQAVEAYKKITHLTEEDRNHLLRLQCKLLIHLSVTFFKSYVLEVLLIFKYFFPVQIAEVHDLRGLFVLLLRHYNPALQSHQFLQDLIVTNHNLLIFVENTVKLPEFQANVDLVQHLKQYVFLRSFSVFQTWLQELLKHVKLS